MKKNVFLVLIGILFLFNSFSLAAVHRVGDGEVISTIAEKIGCSVTEIAAFNNISAPDYVIVKGQLLRYLDQDDLEDARQWAEEYLFSNDPKDTDYSDIQQVIADIDAGTIEYSNGSVYTHASEILILADAFRAR